MTQDTPRITNNLPGPHCPKKTTHSIVLSVTEVCQKGAFDDDAWEAVMQGMTISGLSGSSRWPGGEPASRATSAVPSATPQGAVAPPVSSATSQPTR